MQYRLVTITCSSCSAHVSGGRGETTRHLRDRLADAGWFTDWRRDFDMCPSCLEHNPQHRVATCPGCGRTFSLTTGF